MRRRGFIAVLGAAAAWPLAGYAQQPERMRRVGVLMAFSENDPPARASVNAFTQALGRLGWIEGKNIQIDYRFAARRSSSVGGRCRGTGRPIAGRNSGNVYAVGRGAAAADARNTNRFRTGVRSRRTGLCSEPRATRRQHHRVQRL